MDILKDKSYRNYTYRSRYASVPFYFNSVDKKYIYGIGSNIYKDFTYVSHLVKESDNLDYLALKYYNNPTLWWVIAYANDIQDSLCNLAANYKTLKIPNISDIEFGNER